MGSGASTTALGIAGALSASEAANRLGCRRNGRSSRVANGSHSSLAGSNRSPRGGIVRTVRAQPVAGAGADPADMAVEHVPGARGERDPRDLLLPGGIEQAERDGLGMGREHRHVDALHVGADAERLRGAGPDRAGCHAGAPARRRLMVSCDGSGMHGLRSDPAPEGRPAIVTATSGQVDSAPRPSQGNRIWQERAGRAGTPAARAVQNPRSESPG